MAHVRDATLPYNDRVIVAALTEVLTKRALWYLLTATVHGVHQIDEQGIGRHDLAWALQYAFVHDQDWNDGAIQHLQKEYFENGAVAMQDNPHWKYLVPIVVRLSTVAPQGRQFAKAVASETLDRIEHWLPDILPPQGDPCGCELCQAWPHTAQAFAAMRVGTNNNDPIVRAAMKAIERLST